MADTASIWPRYRPPAREPRRDRFRLNQLCITAGHPRVLPGRPFRAGRCHGADGAGMAGARGRCPALIFVGRAMAGAAGKSAVGWPGHGTPWPDGRSGPAGGLRGTPPTWPTKLNGFANRLSLAPKWPPRPPAWRICWLPRLRPAPRHRYRPMAIVPADHRGSNTVIYFAPTHLPIGRPVRPRANPRSWRPPAVGARSTSIMTASFSIRP